MIYLDNAATTPVDPEVLEAMLPYFTQCYGNASGIYEIAAVSKSAIRLARERAADMIGAQPEEIFFTSGGTESANWASLEGARIRAAAGGSAVYHEKRCLPHTGQVF